MLVGLLAKAPDALRADFRKHYSVSLRQAMEDDLLEAADMAAHLPADKTSAVFRALNPEVWRWSEADHMQAMQLDALNLLVWLKTEDATKKPPRNRPKPIPRPGVVERQKEAEGRFKDVQPRDPDELMRRLSLPRRAVTG